MTKHFTVQHTDNQARAALLPTMHGTIQTPFFMSVATQAAIKGAVSAQDLLDVQAPVMLCNTYHLLLRPGPELIKQAGGLHNFTGWSGPILTDSGGFQVFSIKSKKFTDTGVTFRSHLNGDKLFMDAEISVQTQHDLGADIIMAFDDCPPNKPDFHRIRRAINRTTEWGKRSLEYHFQRYSNTLDITKRPQIFGIIQGGCFPELRAQSHAQITALPFDGYALGGLAVGETKEQMYQTVRNLAPTLPYDKPRYLMGIGTPSDLLVAIGAGIDMFDCVFPARNARHGKIYTWDGSLNITNSRFRADFSPLDQSNETNPLNHMGVTRAYLHHLFKAKEDLGKRYATMQNLYFYHDLMRTARDKIIAGEFYDWQQNMLERWSRE